MLRGFKGPKRGLENQANNDHAGIIFSFLGVIGR